MYSSTGSDLKDLLAEYPGDPITLQALVIDEIERALPQIVANLYVPTLSDKHRRRLLEYRLNGRPGFRRFNSGEREAAIQELEYEKYLTQLRNTQEHLSKGQLEGTTKHRYIVGFGENTEANTTLTVSVEDITHARASKTSKRSAQFAEHSIETELLDTNLHVFEGALPLASITTPPNWTARFEHDVVEDVLEIPDIPIELQEPVANRDVRDLIAIIKRDTLISFVDPSLRESVPKGFRDIRVPRKRLYSALNLEQLIQQYHELASFVDLPSERIDELRLLDALIGALEREAQWSRINTRRFHLINKKHSLGLSAEEIDELYVLDQLAEKQMYKVQSLPFDELAMLKTYTHRLGFDEDHLPSAT